MSGSLPFPGTAYGIPYIGYTGGDCINLNKLCLSQVSYEMGNGGLTAYRRPEDKERPDTVCVNDAPEQFARGHYMPLPDKFLKLFRPHPPRKRGGGGVRRRPLRT